MELNLFKDVKKDFQPNGIIKSFMEELTEFLGQMTLPQNNVSSKTNAEKILETRERRLDQRLNENRKEGHLYFVTEDRNNEIYLWDFTDKPKHEFKEIINSEELLNVAKEGAMLQYKNGKYELYSSEGYDMLFSETNNVHK